jgi:hypothetical protein
MNKYRPRALSVSPCHAASRETSGRRAGVTAQNSELVTIMPARLAADCGGLDDRWRWGKMVFETTIGGCMRV